MELFYFVGAMPVVEMCVQMGRAVYRSSSSLTVSDKHPTKHLAKWSKDCFLQWFWFVVSLFWDGATSEKK